MNKKGFTTLEFLTVVSIFSIILVFSIPMFNATVKESKADQLEDVRQMVAAAARTYLESDSGDKTLELLYEKENIRIYLNVINDSGYITDKIKNPMTGKYFDITTEYVDVLINEIGIIEYKFSF